MGRMVCAYAYPRKKPPPRVILERSEESRGGIREGTPHPSPKATPSPIKRGRLYKKQTFSAVKGLQNRNNVI